MTKRLTPHDAVVLSPSTRKRGYINMKHYPWLAILANHATQIIFTNERVYKSFQEACNGGIVFG